jgi:hypothetical protein
MKQKPTRKMPSIDQRPTNEDIAAAAYQLYVESGYQDGRDQENWLQAESSLAQKLRPTATVQATQSPSNITGQSSDNRDQQALKLPATKDLQWNSGRTTKASAAAVSRRA